MHLFAVNVVVWRFTYNYESQEIGRQLVKAHLGLPLVNIQLKDNSASFATPVVLI